MFEYASVTECPEEDEDDQLLSNAISVRISMTAAARLSRDPKRRREAEGSARMAGPAITAPHHPNRCSSLKMSFSGTCGPDEAYAKKPAQH